MSLWPLGGCVSPRAAPALSVDSAAPIGQELHYSKLDKLCNLFNFCQDKFAYGKTLSIEQIMGYGNYIIGETAMEKGAWTKLYSTVPKYIDILPETATVTQNESCYLVTLYLITQRGCNDCNKDSSKTFENGGELLEQDVRAVVPKLVQPLVQGKPLAGRAGLFTLLQANGGCGKRRGPKDVLADLPAALIGLEQRTAAGKQTGPARQGLFLHERRNKFGNHCFRGYTYGSLN
ncbi:hypothetical protein UY3_06896 [Chelonia mydas]|uniref:Uncharacterized protein n=1 Tax=Chelonia mydas TaxID=8469 RepID=M7BJP5_CHEMY|nr:hypothetical protein UY3_06896 [Chelonia mydas]